jgi:aquaporin Z
MDFQTDRSANCSPLLGALIGVAFEWILKGKPTATGAIAAQGALDSDDSTPPVMPVS